MSNNLPIKEDNSFFEKIKNFFRRLLKKQNTQEVANFQVEEKIENKEDKAKERFENSIKVKVKYDYINDMKREEFIYNLEKDPKLFYELPIEKLEKLEDYYKDSVKKQEEKLAKIKKAS